MHRLHQSSKVVGTKQTLKALKSHQVTVLYVARDADPSLIEELTGLANASHIPVVYVPTMKELGKACEVEVKTATAALIVNN